MTDADFKNPDDDKMSLTPIPIFSTLLPGTRTMVEAFGGTMHLVAQSAFLELANIGNSFNILFHSFELKLPKGWLQFRTTSQRYTPGIPLRFEIGVTDIELFLPLACYPPDFRVLLTEISEDRPELLEPRSSRLQAD